MRWIQYNEDDKFSYLKRVKFQVIYSDTKRGVEFVDYIPTIIYESVSKKRAEKKIQDMRTKLDTSIDLYILDNEYEYALRKKVV